MDDTELRTHLDGIDTHVAAIRAGLAPAGPPQGVRLVKSGANFQAELAAGGAMQLESGATFEGQRFTFQTPGTVVWGGRGTTLHTTQGPSLFVPPGMQRVTAFDLICLCDTKTEAPVRLGAADATQVRLDQVPHTIHLVRIVVPSHRGKRGFSIHSTQTELLDCEAHDIWTPGQDSQPWWIHNTPGLIKILGGAWSAGSELCLFGGAPFNIPKLVPTGVEVAHGLYYRPAWWQTDGIDREIKNGMECKNAADVWFHHLTVRGCWQFAQPVSAAFMFTPTQGGSVVGVRVEDIDLENCTDVMSVTGRTDDISDPVQTTGIVVRRLRGSLKKGSSRGVLLLAQRHVGSVTFEECEIDTDGTKLCEFVDATDRFHLSRSIGRLGKYGLTFGGFHASLTADPVKVNVADLKLEGNTFGGPGATPKFGARFPGNRLVPAGELDALLAKP